LGLLPLVLLVTVLAVASVRDHLTEGRGGEPANAGQDRLGTVLLVAGYGGSTRSLEALGAALRAAGRTVVIVPPVGNNTGDLREQAKALDRVARRMIGSGAPSVDVIGYSAGGVVARIWAADLGGAALARRIITVGSPHHGTDAAALAASVLAGSCPTACRQLIPGSDLLTGLPEPPAGPHWTSIWTAADDLVMPASSASLRGAVNIEVQLICADSQVKHGGLPADPLTIGLVERVLGGPTPPTPPVAADCAALRRAGLD
jgi:triacylglycerol esterase/lipase EstA (alpha/beta hydrolase family)